ncbi:NAD(P)/FAD-dependent oxidoreductase [Anaeromyxobacter paludicola]|uniref:NADH:ubiquinone reductase (non-electrogenic) n=1 Tax=Anaeromyxobacter paludicola TaxID=2918171 RepID=A0ABN6NA05_9BACT|nr:NAD(P)/FAD-dependent oxidoreductase [Anaeromyxobacter paludicola]BDG09175.1 NADH dehydrogenase [Anaeromyxobacter paludicola]
MAERPHLVIVGAGFAGLYCARALSRAPVRITLLDRQNHHLFQPLLYQVATATLSVGDIAAPVRHVFRKQKNVEVLLGDVKSIDPVARRVLLGDRSLAYDHCLLAAGTTHSYFGHPEWARYAPGLKTLEDAIEIRRRILTAFEMAEREPDPARQRAWLTFVVVGAGPTGVELAGALTEIARFSMGGDFRRIDPGAARVVLVEGAPRVLPPFPEPLSEKARRQLEKIGVEVRTGTPVSRIDASGVTLGEEHLAARTVLWGAGVAASPVARSLGVALDRAGRVRVMPDLTVPGYPELYVAGDLAAISRPDGRPVPGVAPAAIQMGRHVARNVLAGLEGKPRQPFRYWDKGSLATIGRAAAVAEFAGIRLSGILAWLAWLLVHIYFLIGFRNRFAVLAHWAWSYVTFERGSRLITDTASHARLQALEAEEAEAAAIARRRRTEG